MPRGDGKGKFYRTLNLDKEEWLILKTYNKLKEKMIKDLENQEIEDEES